MCVWEGRGWSGSEEENGMGHGEEYAREREFRAASPRTVGIKGGGGGRQLYTRSTAKLLLQNFFIISIPSSKLYGCSISRIFGLA